MSRYYYEQRDQHFKGTAGLVSDITKHLYARKHLGKAMVICDNPMGLMCVARKQWLRLTRTAQNQRASTLNADRILRLTYAITHMQRITFVAKTPLQIPAAHIFFVTPDQLEFAPNSCYSVYATTKVQSSRLERLIKQMPDSALVIDYVHGVNQEEVNLHPKQKLTDNTLREWDLVKNFLHESGIDISKITSKGVWQHELVDEAMDVLLNESHRFLQVAGNFQHARELAQPHEEAVDEQKQYEMVSLLAHRVQALSPGAFTLPIEDAFHEEETFFLHDCPDEDISTLTSESFIFKDEPTDQIFDWQTMHGSLADV